MPDKLFAAHHERSVGRRPALLSAERTMALVQLSRGITYLEFDAAAKTTASHVVLR